MSWRDVADFLSICLRRKLLTSFIRLCLHKHQLNIADCHTYSSWRFPFLIPSAGKMGFRAGRIRQCLCRPFPIILLFCLVVISGVPLISRNIQTSEAILRHHLLMPQDIAAPGPGCDGTDDLANPTLLSSCRKGCWGKDPSHHPPDLQDGSSPGKMACRLQFLQRHSPSG